MSMGLGAERGKIRRLVIAHGLKLALTGMVLGILCGLALARFMRNLLFGTSATDPLTLAMVGGVLMLVAVAACWIPARRATRVDPMIALRYEGGMNMRRLRSGILRLRDLVRRDQLD